LIGEVIQTLTYGVCKDGDLDLVALGRERTRIFSRTTTGYVVDFLPWLKYIPSWFPGAQFKRDAKRWSIVSKASRLLPFNMVKRKKAAGEIIQTSFTSLLLEDNDV